MPPVILWMLGAAGAALAGRWLFKESRRINAELHPDESVSPREERQEVPTLERDPRTGVYRPK